MINNVVVGGQVYAINANTQEVTQTRELGYRYVRNRFFVENSGKFIFPKAYNLEAIDVEAGDLIIVFETNDGYRYIKANMKEAISIMDDIDIEREKARKQRCESCECQSSCSCPDND